MLSPFASFPQDKKSKAMLGLAIAALLAACVTIYIFVIREPDAKPPANADIMQAAEGDEQKAFEAQQKAQQARDAKRKPAGS